MECLCAACLTGFVSISRFILWKMIPIVYAVLSNAGFSVLGRFWLAQEKFVFSVLGDMMNSLDPMLGVR